MNTHAFISSILLLFIISTASAADLAWNGHTIPGSTKKEAFTPYFVPLGAKSYDSSSPLVRYSGQWKEIHSDGDSTRGTESPGSSVSMTFVGNAIEWFGSTGNKNGISRVYIDGILVQEVDSYSRSPLKRQRIFWKFSLPPTKHTIKIVNTSQRPRSLLDFFAFVVTLNSASPTLDNSSASSFRGLVNLATSSSFNQSFLPSQWSLEQKGTTGVSAMQLAIISSELALIVDKVEHNPLTVDGHPAWAALFNLNTRSVTPLDMQSNSFCAGGSFLSNGTLINVGGNPIVTDHTSAADFGDVNGLQGIRLLNPCEQKNCRIYENHARIRMATPRWYSTVVRLPDGSAMIIGGSKKGGWMNNATVNNPTIEYYPPKSIHGSNGLPIHLPFLVDTLNSNLFPIAFVLPDGKVLMVANSDAMIYDWEANTERRLPSLPNGVRVTYPMTGTGVLLPLSSTNGYAPEILICGGSTIDDHKPSWEVSSQDPASSQCTRMLLTDEGIASGWQVENMPQSRVMVDAILLPTGDVVLVNGAMTGISGYGNVQNQVGASNADHPALSPLLYNPSAAPDQRFSGGMPTSEIPRLYHSVATLTPSGEIMIAGSNPNLDRSEVKYGTEYRVEWLRPPYMTVKRPEIKGHGKKMAFGGAFTLKVEGIEKDGIIKGIENPQFMSAMSLTRLSSGNHGLGLCNSRSPLQLSFCLPRHQSNRARQCDGHWST